MSEEECGLTGLVIPVGCLAREFFVLRDEGDDCWVRVLSMETELELPPPGRSNDENEEEADEGFDEGCCCFLLEFVDVNISASLDFDFVFFLGPEGAGCFVGVSSEAGAVSGRCCLLLARREPFPSFLLGLAGFRGLVVAGFARADLTIAWFVMSEVDFLGGAAEIEADSAWPPGP